MLGRCSQYSGCAPNILVQLDTRVVMLGGTGVGKSSLCSQFLSSDHADTYERVEDSVEKEVVVAVNDKQSRIVFIDHQHGELSLENLVKTKTTFKYLVKFQLATYDPHAFLVVLAVDDVSSLDTVSLALRVVNWL